MQTSKKPATTATVISCNVDGCTFSCSKATTLRIHQTRCHAEKVTQKPQKSMTSETAFSCSFAGCNFSGSSSSSLQMHRIRCHKSQVANSQQTQRDDAAVGAADECRPAERQTKCNRKHYFCDITGCTWSPVWTYSALTKQKNRTSRTTCEYNRGTFTAKYRKGSHYETVPNGDTND